MQCGKPRLQIIQEFTQARMKQKGESFTCLSPFGNVI
jgi:hypothetical protein